MDPIRARLPVLLFLGSLFLAMACASVGLAYWEKENPKYRVCVKSCDLENDASRYLACHARCRLTNDEKDPQRARQREEEQKERDPREQEREQERRRPEKHRREEEEEEEQGQRHHLDPEERARERQRQEREERQREKERERRRREKEKEREEEQERQRQETEEQKEQEKQKQKQHNPYHLRSDRFQTRFQNKHGRIRVLQRFDQRSEQLRALKNYRVVEFESKPETLILPHHADAEYLLVVLRGRAIFTIVNQNNRESYNLEEYDVLRVPPGAICYAANRDNNQNLKIHKLILSVNIPGEFENFYPSGNQNPQSYYNVFSKRTLEAAFNTNYDEIQRILFGEQEQQEKGKEQEQKQSSEEGVIVKLSKEQLRELSRHAKSSPGGGRSLRSGPFNLRNLQPRYSNNYGNFREARPQDFQLLQDLGVSISVLNLNEGSLFLPHYNSRAIVLAHVVEGKGQLEIACPHLANQKSEEESEESEQKEEEEEEEEEEEQREGQIQGVSAKLCKGDVYVIPAGHPVAVRASKKNKLKVVEFILNAEYNQRNFLAGERDNVINQIEMEVKGLAFEGSGQEVEKLFGNQNESYFVNLQSQQREGRKGKRVPLSSILGAFI